MPDGSSQQTEGKHFAYCVAQQARDGAEWRAAVHRFFARSLDENRKLYKSIKSNEDDYLLDFYIYCIYLMVVIIDKYLFEEEERGTRARPFSHLFSPFSRTSTDVATGHHSPFHSIVNRRIAEVASDERREKSSQRSALCQSDR